MNSPAAITRIPLTIVSSVDGARTDSVLVGVLASELDEMAARVAVVRPTRDALTQCIDHAINGPDLDGDPSGGWMASHIAESLIRAGFVAVSDSQETHTKGRE